MGVSGQTKIQMFMKNFFISAGLLAAGAAGFQATALGQGNDIISPKAWSVAATLRGFYDDNYNIGGAGKGSFGGEISPSISVNVPLQQTDMGIRYIYGLYYYEDRDALGLQPFDHTHQVEIWLDHAINERWKLNVTDTFAIGQEPELLQPDPTTGRAVTYRVNGDNMANHANVTLDTQWTRLFGTALHYGNNFYSYDNNGGMVGPQTTPGFFPLMGSVFPPVNSHVGMPGWNQFINPDGTPGGGASLAGLLDRIEQSVGLDLNWTFSPETKVFAGYNFSWVNYLGNEPITVYNYVSGLTPVGIGMPPVLVGFIPTSPQSVVYNSDSRDSRSHNVYVGFSHQVTANISAMVNVGATYTDSYNDPLGAADSLSPSANASISYTYSPGSYVQVGVSHGENATDQVAPEANGRITAYQHSTVFFADLNHRITEKLMGTVIGRYSYSTFERGAASGSGDISYNFGVNLSYQISRHFNAELGYNYDLTDSALLGRGYARNRVYFGLGATY